MRHAVLVLLLLCCGSLQAAEDLVGDWKGTLAFGGQSLEIVLHVTSQKGERVEGNLDIPQQGALGLAFSEMSFRNDTLSGTMNMVQATCQLVLVKPDILEGMWFQSGVESTMKLQKSLKDLGPVRPQNPQPPFPYDRREVTFNGADGSLLEGTLVLPHGIDAPVPAVVLVTGSGPQDRDESLNGHKPFLVLADYLARKGIASLRYDERGVGKSGGDFATATTQDFLADAAEGVQFLRAQQHVDSNKVGVIGHSEGGLIATLLSVDERINFGIAMAGPTMRGDSLLIMQSKKIFHASGMSALLPIQIAVQNAAFSAATEYATAAERKTVAMKRLEAVREEFGEKALVSLGLNEVGIQTFVEQVNQPWMIEFLQLHPLEGVASIDVPFFFLFGGKDVQVPAEESVNSLKESGIVEHSDAVEVKVYPELNHLFQKARTGLPNEYALIEETVNEEVLRDIAAFILAL